MCAPFSPPHPLSADYRPSFHCEKTVKRIPLYSQMCSCLSSFINHPFINHLTTYFLPLGNSFLFFPLQSLSLTPSILSYLLLLKYFSHASVPWHVIFTLPEITSPLPSRFTPPKQEAQERVPCLY